MTRGSASGGDSRSVFAAGVSRGPWWVLVHQANSFLEDFEEVRKAWGGLVKKSEAGPTVAEVEKALDLVGEADLQDSKMKMSLVKLILALRTTQEFEMRYRSTAPGRPWVYMTRTLVFPDPETVQAVRDRHEWDGTIHIAATQLFGSVPRLICAAGSLRRRVPPKITTLATRFELFRGGAFLIGCCPPCPPGHLLRDHIS